MVLGSVLNFLNKVHQVVVKVIKRFNKNKLYRLGLFSLFLFVSVFYISSIPVSQINTYIDKYFSYHFVEKQNPSIVKGVQIKQLPSLPGEPIKWVAIVPASVISSGQHLVEIPKSAKEIKVTQILKSNKEVNKVGPDNLFSLTKEYRQKLSEISKKNAQSPESLSLAKSLNKKQKNKITNKPVVSQNSFAGLISSIQEILSKLGNTKVSADVEVGEVISQPVSEIPQIQIIDIAPKETEQIVESTPDELIPVTVNDNNKEEIVPILIDENVSLVENPDTDEDHIETPINTEITTENNLDNTAESTSTTSVADINISSIDKITDEISTTTSSSSPSSTSISTSTASSTSNDILLEYQTPAPIISEASTETGKIVTISDNVGDVEGQTHTTNVLAFTNIPEIYKVGQENKIKIKWINNNNQDVQFNAYDLNDNGKLDYVEWTVPHLSTQIFEIVFISKAFQLDVDKNIISDIYDLVRKRDNKYSSISNNQYLRATFGQILNNTNDITVYARSTDLESAASIEVYPVYIDSDGNQTEGNKLDLVNDNINPNFSEINEQAKYRILLSNLQTPTDIFDLKIIGNINVDYIVDPTTSITISTGADTCALCWDAGSPTNNYTATGADVINATTLANKLSEGNVVLTGATNDITVSNAVTKTSGGDTTLTMYAGKSVIVNAGITSTSGKLNMLLNSDRDADSSGYIYVAGALTSNGGDITIGGGSGTISAGTGFAVGNSDSGKASGVYVNGVAVSAGGGNIIINGQGYDTTTNNNHGVLITAINGAVTTTGSGTIKVTGNGSGNTNSSTNHGVMVSTSGVISTVDGNLTVVGVGGGAGTGLQNFGVYVALSGTIKTTGLGNLSATGTGGNTSGSGGINAGVYLAIANSIQATGSGSISITGNGGNTSGSGSTNSGVYCGAVTCIQPNSTGSLTITGVGGGSSNTANYGVNVGPGYSIIGAGAPITITGTGGNSSGNSNFGVYITGAGALISNSGTGTISITGNGGGNTNSSSNYGAIVSTGGTVSTADGNLTVVGFGGGAGTGGLNSGVYVATAGTIKTTGLGNLSATGTGGNVGGTGATNAGVYIVTTNGLQATGSGTISITGNGGSASGGAGQYGVYCGAATCIQPNSTGSLTITGVGGAGLNINYGVFVAAGSSIVGAGAPIVITGAGGNSSGNNNHGVVVGGVGALISNSGSGTISITGNGAGNTNSSSDYGVTVTVGGIISTVDGDLTVIGVGGGSGTGQQNFGVYAVDTNSTIKTTGSGNLSVTGTGGNVSGTGTTNRGVYVVVTKGIQATGSGSISITGTGGNASGPGSNNQGVYCSAATCIQPNATGSLTITGTGAGGGAGNHGIYVGVGYSIAGSGAPIIITGNAGNSSGNNNYGVFVTGANTVISNSGTGTISITGNGAGNTNSASDHGVMISVGGVISVVDGNLTVVGSGGGAGTGGDNYGVSIQVTNGIQATGSGSISITGTGGNTSGSGASNYGISCGAANCIQPNATGSLTITGVGGGSSGITNHGIYVAAGYSIVGAGAPIIITGTGGNSSGNSNHGVFVTGSGAVISNSGTGTISITGNGSGNTNSSTDRGVYTSTGAVISTVDGSLTVVGVGGEAASGVDGHGVFIASASTIKTTGLGNLSVTGTGGIDSGNGVGVNIVTANGLQATGSGTISVTGNGGSASGGATQYGISCGAATCIQPNATGSLTITGVGGAGLNANHGIYVAAGYSIIGAGAPITITGTGGNSSGNSNFGVYITGAGALISNSGTGTISIIGNGGGNTNSSSDCGIIVSVGGVISTADGNLTAVGSGGGSGTGGLNSGVFVVDTNSTIKTTGLGNLSVTGIRGGGDTSNNYGLRISVVNGLQTTSAGSITALTDTILLAQADDINSATSLIIKPYTAGNTVGVGAGAGTLPLSDTYLGYITWGAGSTLTIGGTNTGDITVNTSSTILNKNVTFISGGNISLVTTALAHSGVSSSTLTMQAYEDIAISSAITADTSPLTVLLYPDFDNNGSGSISIGAGVASNGGVITIQGGGGSISTTSAFDNLTINTTGNTITLATVLNVTGDLTITSGTLDVSNTGCSGSSCLISLGGNFSNSAGVGGFNARTGTVSINGTNKLITGTTTFNILSGSGDVLETSSGITVGTNNTTITTNNGSIITNNAIVTTNSLSGTIDTNNLTVSTNNGVVNTNTSLGTIGNNAGTLTNANAGIITTNNSSFATNDGTVGNNASGIINTNNGTIVLNNSTVSINASLGLVDTNNKDVVTNDGVITENDILGIVGTNNLAVSTNNGVVNTNSTSGTVNINNLTVSTNNGVVNTNSASGVVDVNNLTINTNNGVVNTNSALGTIDTNNLTVSTNNGVVNTNSTSGTVNVNNLTVSVNNGVVNTNSASGVVDVNNLTINTNNGTTTNNAFGSIINNNFGSIKLNNGTADTNIFNEGEYNGSTGIITGDATFLYLTAISGQVVDVTEYANGVVGGTTKDTMGETITHWIFNNTNNNGKLTGNAIFNATTSNTGTVDGNVIFNASSTNSGTIMHNVDVYYPVTRPIGGTIYGLITYHNYPGFYFNDKDTNDGDWDNPNNWWIDNSFSTPAGDVPGAGDVVTVYSDIFTNSSSNIPHAGSLTFEGGSINFINIDVSGDVIFNSTSSNAVIGLITAGIVTFVGDLSDNNGTVVGTVVRLFTQAVTTVRKFAGAEAEGGRNDWVVIARGVVVDISGAIYDRATNIFKALDGGLFTTNSSINGGSSVVPVVVSNLPIQNQTVIKWVPSVNWGNSISCEYSYNNWITTSTVICGSSGADIERPATSTNILSLRGIDAVGNIKEQNISFTYDNISPVWTTCGTDLLDEPTRDYYYLKDGLVTGDCHLRTDVELRGSMIGTGTLTGGIFSDATSTDGFNIILKKITVTATTSATSAGAGKNGGNITVENSTTNALVSSGTSGSTGGDAGNITVSTSTTGSIFANGADGTVNGGVGGDITILNSDGVSADVIASSNGGSSTDCGDGGNTGVISILNSNNYTAIANAGLGSNRTCEGSSHTSGSIISQPIVVNRPIVVSSVSNVSQTPSSGGTFVQSGNIPSVNKLNLTNLPGVSFKNTTRNFGISNFVNPLYNLIKLQPITKFNPLPSLDFTRNFENFASSINTLPKSLTALSNTLPSIKKELNKAGIINGYDLYSMKNSPINTPTLKQVTKDGIVQPDNLLFVSIDGTEIKTKLSIDKTGKVYQIINVEPETYIYVSVKNTSKKIKAEFNNEEIKVIKDKKNIIKVAVPSPAEIGIYKLLIGELILEVRVNKVVTSEMTEPENTPNNNYVQTIPKADLKTNRPSFINNIWSWLFR